MIEGGGESVTEIAQVVHNVTQSFMGDLCAGILDVGVATKAIANAMAQVSHLPAVLNTGKRSLFSLWPVWGVKLQA